MDVSILRFTRRPTVRDLFSEPPPPPPPALVQERAKTRRVRTGAIAAGAVLGALALGLPDGKIPAAAVVCLPSMLVSLKGVLKATHLLEQKTKGLPSPWSGIVMCGSISVLALAGFAGMIGPMILTGKVLPLLPHTPLVAVAGAAIGGALGAASAYLFQNFNGSSELESAYRGSLETWKLQQKTGPSSGPGGLEDRDRSIQVGAVRLPKKSACDGC